MTVPCMTYTELMEEHLKPNGYEVIAPQPDEFWEGYNRIMIRKGDYTFPLQYKSIYFYLQIVYLFRQLEIPVPEEYQHIFDQHMAMRKGLSLERTIEENTDEKEEDSGTS
ncbi:MAG: hypothetical protein WKF85_13810 [Chitinophagaceae bacterium]